MQSQVQSIFFFFLALKGRNSAPQEMQTCLSVLHCAVIHSDQNSASLNTSSRKWIFKDLHIYITEFLSLQFSKSAELCPEYVNSALVPHSWERGDGERVCCWLRSQTLKDFSVCLCACLRVRACTCFLLHLAQQLMSILTKGFHFINICTPVFQSESAFEGWRTELVVRHSPTETCIPTELGCGSAGGVI